MTACAQVPDSEGRRSELRAEFSTMTSELLALRDWLNGLGVTHVAMEATGVYWKPVYFSAEIEELRGLGDLTIARARSHGHGVQSEAPMEQTVWHVAKWRRKQVIWWRFVRREDEALEAAGLPD